MTTFRILITTEGGAPVLRDRIFGHDFTEAAERGLLRASNYSGLALSELIVATVPQQELDR